MRIILAAIDSSLSDAWRVAFRGTPVQILDGDIFETEAECYVSPANSFGFMNGGIDAEYLERWPWIEKQVREKILEGTRGEILPGEAIFTSVGSGRPDYADTQDDTIICVAPTMRVPMKLPHGTINPFLATRAALVIASRRYGINSIAFPGMGTGRGKVPVEVCAGQMRAAYDEYTRGPTQYVDAVSAIEAHRRLAGLTTEEIR